MAHHRDAAFRELRGQLRHPAPALELDGVHPRLEQVDSVGGGLLDRPLVGAERHVRDEQLVGRGPGHGAGVVKDLVHGDRQRRGVAEVVVAHAVAHQQRGHAGLSEKPGHRRSRTR